jgi:hypothetical protein
MARAAVCMASDSGTNVIELPGTGTLTPIPFDTDDHDPDGYHDPVATPTRFTVPAGLAGWHRFSATLRPGQTSSTSPPKEYFLALRITFAAGGTVTTAARSGVLGASYALDVVYAWTPFYDLAAGDFVELFYQHNTGTSAYLDNSLGHEARFNVERLGTGTGGDGGGTADVTITTDASLTATEAPANTFALAARLSPDAGNALSLHANGLYSTDTGSGGGGTGNTTMYTQTSTPTGAANSLWFNPSESA